MSTGRTAATTTARLSTPAAPSPTSVSASVSTTKTTSSLGSTTRRPVQVSTGRTEATTTARLSTLAAPSPTSVTSVVIAATTTARLSPPAAPSPTSAMPTATTALPLSDNVCDKCGTARNGKTSCCAPGGAWFSKCGEPGDSNFDHTWSDGIQECRGEFLTPWH